MERRDYRCAIPGSVVDPSEERLQGKGHPAAAVPGSFELPTGAALMSRKRNIDAVICIGCVIQGETRHFEFICQAVANGLVTVSLKYDKPVIFGVLTTDNMKQAKDRSGW
jgi:6,7-dimethyl-8-ribityllumazine synthase